MIKQLTRWARVWVMSIAAQYSLSLNLNHPHLGLTSVKPRTLEATSLCSLLLTLSTSVWLPLHGNDLYLFLFINNKKFQMGQAKFLIICPLANSSPNAKAFYIFSTHFIIINLSTLIKNYYSNCLINILF